ncbi:tyrosine-type recombinase/integrase [Actinophytocola sp.]|uniref:tyrosine-type recombinase/integrase n=1 Tax=Actinophytocola sp. TaxID=1872138 RepID=UPI002D7EBB6D|nr:tyrosine-type recombinase/integrase [Actinophytocola sp.]HET9143307.1 tyrosine-type recombinase/integrase [Actinophytocola sp.]
MAWTEQIGEHSWRVRYVGANGRVASIGGFDSREAAEDYALVVEGQQRQGVWVDPMRGRTTVAEWVDVWFDSLDVDERTRDNYASRLRCHILPRWGDTRLIDISTLQVTSWITSLHEDRRARATVAGIVKLFSMMLTDAVDEDIIPFNPVRRRRHRGRRHHVPERERVWTTPEKVLRIADQAEVLGGPGAGLLIVTAGWTGCRWGELAGLHRAKLRLDEGCLIVDGELGALHESCHGRWLGPPKTASSARSVSLPPFLIALLRNHLRRHPHEFVFTTESGTWLWRSTFSRRVLRPAVDGNLAITKPRVRTQAIAPGLTFHGLRHSHKTWLIADGVPEIAQARRLGHHLDNRVVETYSHVAPEVERRLLHGLERRWRKAVTIRSTRPVTILVDAERASA